MNYPKYAEMSFKDAFVSFPELFNCIPYRNIKNFLADDKYIVKIDFIKKCLEIGYSSDSWIIRNNNY